MGLIIRLLLLAIIVYAVVYVFTSIKKALSSVNNPIKDSEACPSCGQSIQVSGENMVCPHCLTKLGRTEDGKLVIRVN